MIGSYPMPAPTTAPIALTPCLSARVRLSVGYESTRCFANQQRRPLNQPVSAAPDKASAVFNQTTGDQ